jgi:hypothetical protein
MQGLAGPVAVAGLGHDDLVDGQPELSEAPQAMMAILSYRRP